MRLSSESMQDGHPLPERHAFGIPDPERHQAWGRNLSPHLAWTELPAGTRSLALVCHDPDAPARASEVNREDREIPADLPRTDFFHWLLADLDPGIDELPEGLFADGVVPGGKREAHGPLDTHQGVNDYTDLLAEEPAMAGTYYGYDGPCPPWNDAVPHRYVFTLYALDTAQAPVATGYRGADLLRAVRPHVLAQARLTVTYSLNPRAPA